LAGQTSANDNNANVTYPTLDGRIRDTYAARSTATLKSSLYDSYIRAFRWASDRIGDAGVMAYVSNAGWLDGNAADGMRACLTEEFSDLYVFNLRGNARTSGEQRRKERGNVFGEGTRTPVAISLFVKNPEATEHGRIHFHDIGDYLDQKQKLLIVRDFAGIGGIAKVEGWSLIQPDEHNDWLNQRDGSFDAFIKIGDKKDRVSPSIFASYTSGVKTQRDAWCYNFSAGELSDNVRKTSDHYNRQVEDYSAEMARGKNINTDKFIDTDTQKISWTRALKWDLEKEKKLDGNFGEAQSSVYRPFVKEWLFLSRRLNEIVGQVEKIFPKEETNPAISVTGTGSKNGFSVLMIDRPPSYDMMEKGQCYPLHLYAAPDDDPETEDMFASIPTSSIFEKQDGVTDAGLKHFQDAYPGETITKEDLFYYVYGLLHSEDYRAKYADNLSKELPRIPRVKTAADFWAFSRAGRTLGDLHVNYETVEPYPVTIKQGNLLLADTKNPEALYRVTKWAFGKSGKDKDKTTVIYNANITMQDIPLEAYDYVVNGKPALEWVMERQVVKTD
jgi:predicted helicase